MEVPVPVCMNDEFDANFYAKNAEKGLFFLKKFESESGFFACRAMSNVIKITNILTFLNRFNAKFSNGMQRRSGTNATGKTKHDKNFFRWVSKFICHARILLLFWPVQSYPFKADLIRCGVPDPDKNT
jgi:hypothetical protein